MKTDKKTLFIVLGIFAAVAVVLIVIFALRGSPAGKHDPLPIEQYLRMPRSLGGNTFIIDARIDTQLAYKGDVGRIIAVRTQDEKAMLPIIVLKESTSFNPRVGQPYRLTVAVDENGELILTESEKL